MNEQERVKQKFCSFDIAIDDFLSFSTLKEKDDKIAFVLGKMFTANHVWDANYVQNEAWHEEISDLMDALAKSKAKGWLIFEYSLYSLSDRIDVVLLMDSIVYSLEFKTGKQQVTEKSIEQAKRYAYDLKNFHEASKDLWVCPILIVEHEKTLDVPSSLVGHSEEGLFDLVSVSEKGIAKAIDVIAEENRNPVSKIKTQDDCDNWIQSKTEPSPDILSATKVLYDHISTNKKDFNECFKCDAEHPNIVNTTAVVENVIAKIRKDKTNNKAIIFVAGVPGAGKTVVGLNVAFQHSEVDKAVYVSGNGPLVEVLQSGLRRAVKNDYDDAIANETKPEKIEKLRAEKKSKLDAKRGINWMIEQFSEYKRALDSGQRSGVHVVVFDEAQRAWTKEKMIRDARKKSKGKKTKGLRLEILNAKSEPITLLDESMKALDDWNVIVCLVGLGQDIHDGEEGINEWINALLLPQYSGTQVYMGEGLLAQTIDPIKSELIQKIKMSLNFHYGPEYDGLFLKESLRSVTGNKLHEFTEDVLSGNAPQAKKDLSELEAAGYEIRLSRDLPKAKMWLYSHRSPGGRWGVIASSHADRLKPDGIVSDERWPDLNSWFFAGNDNPKSSNAMQTVLSEFSMEGLEVDRACVCWDLDFMWNGTQWLSRTYSPSKGWRNASSSLARYIKNSYRVLMTRSRFGFVIYVPDTSAMADPITGKDTDPSRPAELYNDVFHFLSACGIKPI
jgi:Uncharacterized conserved protein